MSSVEMHAMDPGAAGGDELSGVQLNCLLQSLMYASWRGVRHMRAMTLQFEGHDAAGFRACKDFRVSSLLEFHRHESLRQHRFGGLLRGREGSPCSCSCSCGTDRSRET